MYLEQVDENILSFFTPILKTCCAREHLLHAVGIKQI